jgi:hypothetical protein
LGERVTTAGESSTGSSEPPEPPEPPEAHATTPGPASDNPSSDGQRPLIERLGLGAIALLLAVVFGALAYAAIASGELFLGVMAGSGALMTVWAAASTLRRG